MNAIQAIFHKPRAIIAMAHFPPLPGQPLHDARGGVDAIRRTVHHDAEVLAKAGVDGILFCNEGDRPYRRQAGPETIAVMSAVVAEVAPPLDIPFGVDVLWDPVAAIAIAAATGARFVREVFTGVYASDFGMWNTDPAEALRFRHQVGADGVRAFYNITAEFASPLAARPIEMTARSAVFSSLADGLCISGALTGTAPDLSLVRAAKAAVGDVAVIANTGIRAETVGEALDAADAVIVGTALKRDGVTWNEVDPRRAGSFLAAAAASGRWHRGRPTAAGVVRVAP